MPITMRSATSIHNIDNYFVLNTRCLPFWRREPKILIDLRPFLPYKEITFVKMTAYDGSRYGVKDFFGETIDAESLEINIAYWVNQSKHYVLQSVHYLPDTKKTFGASLGEYPKTEDELHKVWQFREDAHKEYSDKPIVDILQYTAKPNLWWKVKYAIDQCLTSRNLPNKFI